MKRTSLSLLVLALIAATALFVLPTQQSVIADDHAKKDGKALHDAMEKLNKHYRTVRKLSRKKDQMAETATALGEMLDLSYQSKKYIPKTATTDDLKKKYIVVMNQLIITLAQAENAALEGKHDEMTKHIKALGDIKAAGHELFIADDE